MGVCTLQTSQWCDVHPNQVLGQPAIVKELDLNKISVEEIKGLNEEFNLKVDYPGDASGEVQIAGFCGWFDVHFRVRELPTVHSSVLDRERSHL